MTISKQRPQGHPIQSSLSVLSTLPTKEVQGSKRTTATPLIESRHLPRYLRLPELRELVPFSAATIWRHSKNPASTFPKPVKLSSRITAWNRAEVMAFLAEKEAA